MLLRTATAAARAPAPGHCHRPGRQPRRPVAPVASLKAESGPDSIHDWRGKQMQEAADKYFRDLWSKVRAFCVCDDDGDARTKAPRRGMALGAPSPSGCTRIVFFCRGVRMEEKRVGFPKTQVHALGFP
jgi:hypothetical protein